MFCFPFSLLSVYYLVGILFYLCLNDFDVDIDLVWFMVFNPTFNNISVISWQLVLLVEETGVPRENHQPVASQ